MSSNPDKIEMGLRNLKNHTADMKRLSRGKVNAIFWVLVITAIPALIAKWAYGIEMSDWFWYILIGGAIACEVRNQQLKGWLAGFDYANWNGDEPKELDPEEVQENGATEEMNYRAHW